MNNCINFWLMILDRAPEFVEFYKMMCSEAFNLVPYYDDDEEIQWSGYRMGTF